MTARPRAFSAIALVSALAAAAAVAVLPGAASAQTPALVVDASSGRVLHADHATDPWYPASITKLMTVYVALDQVRRGQAQMDTLLTMSENAASMPPSKLGLRPGMTMTLENAIKVIMVKSANDVATMIGENLGGGSVEGFAALMNGAARRLGMHESRWYNPSGLPDNRQQTSARDMAVLARALLNEFPSQQGLFSIGAVQLGSSIMRNHNGLLGRYPGADGMKTGFICSGGFNVVASATQGGRRIITVVMGYPSARERDLRAADLFDLGFGTSGWASQTVDSLPSSASMTAPDMRASVCGPKRKQPQEDDDAVPAQAGFLNADNPLAALFSPASAVGGTGAPVAGSRRTLGPRVAFAPIPVWIGAQPGGDDDGALRGGRTRVARGRAVKTTRVASRASAPGPAATAFTSAGTPAIMAGKSVDTVKARTRAPTEAALKDNTGPKRIAETKPKHGAVGGTGPGDRKKPGAIASKAKPEAGGGGPDGKPAKRSASAKPPAE